MNYEDGVVIDYEAIAKKTGWSVEDVRMRGVAWCENNSLRPVRYRVAAGHSVRQWAERMPAIVEVRKSSGTTKFYANHPELGCGKDYNTPRDAIVGLVADHGYTGIRIEKLEG